MKPFRYVFLSGLLLGLFLLLLAGCKNNKQVKPVSTSPAKAAPDTAGIQAAMRQYRARNLSLADTAGKQALKQILKASLATGYNDQACSIYMEFARHFASQGAFDSTLHYFQLARPYCNQPNFNKTLPAEYLADLGAFYHSLRSDEVAANNSYYKALKYLKAHNLTENTLTIKLNLYLFATQENLGHPERGLVYLKDAEKLALKLNYIPALISVRTNLGNYYAERKDYPKAREYFSLAVADTEEKWNPAWHPNILMAALVGKGSVFTKTGEAAQAIPYLEKALQIARDNQIVYSEVVAAIELGRAYNALQKFSTTIQLVTQALRAQGEFNWYKEEGYQVLMKAYEGLGQYKPALEYQRKLYAFNDSLSNKETKFALNELEIKFQTANKDKELASRKLLIAQQKSKLSRKNTVITGLAVAAVLAVLISGMFYKNARQKQQLQDLEIETLRSQQEVSNLRATIKGEEQERRRLSRELHDGIGSMLASVIMRFSLLKMQHTQAPTSKDYDEVLQMLQQTGNEVRKTAHNIMPDIVDKQTLYEAVKGFCDTISQGTGLHIEVQFYGDTEAFSSHCRHIIYRIIQELVHNILKHANATEAIVQGMAGEDTFSLTVEDNGAGFDLNTSPKGIGLKNVESRVKSLFGEMQVESAPGKGTTINLEFKCHHLQQEYPKIS